MESSTELINETLQMLSELRKPLKSISIKSESKFIELGKDLQFVYSEAEGLALLNTEIANLVRGDSNDNKLSNIGEFAKKSINRLDACRTQLSEILPSVKSCLNYCKKLYDMCPKVRRIVKTLRMVALNISMESSQQAFSNDTFNIFVKEIKGLAKKMDNISDRMREDSEIIGNDQKNDFNMLLERNDQMSRIADEARDMVSRNIERTENILVRALHVLLRSESHSRKISSLVGDVVVSIQFHDITKQQIDHVVKSLHDLEDLIILKIADLKSQEDRPVILKKARSMLNVQISQVRQVIYEIMEAHKKINRAFEEIAKEIDALLDDIFSLERGSIEGDEHGGQFNLLVTGLEKLEMVMAQGKNLTKDIEEIIKGSSSSALSISDYLGLMEDINMDLHIKAINALIMSKQLGPRGVTLGVLAQDVRGISIGSNEIVSEIVNILKSIGGVATELSCASSKNADDSAIEEKQAANLDNGIQNLSLIYNEFLQKTAHSINRSVDLKARLSNVKSHLDFMEEMKRSLKDALIDMEKIMKKLDHLLLEKVIYISEMDKFKERYTTHEERGFPNKDKMPVGLNKVIDDKWHNDSNELGDNVKLF